MPPLRETVGVKRTTGTGRRVGWLARLTRPRVDTPAREWLGAAGVLLLSCQANPTRTG